MGSHALQCLRTRKHEQSLPHRVTRALYELISIDKFYLDEKVKNDYATQPTRFGFNGLGELVYLRSYSREKDGGGKEQWHETVERVVNGTFSMQKRWTKSSGLPWNEDRAQTEACDMYDRIFNMKFLPPGRGLWAMGSSLTENKDKRMYAALNNCAFVSTEKSAQSNDPTKPFCFLMDASMLGVGRFIVMQCYDKMNCIMAIPLCCVVI